MLTVFVLGSRHDERHVKGFWMHLSVLRRQVVGVTWATVYVEDMVDANAIVPVGQDPYIVVGCISSTFLSILLDEPALRELIEGAHVRIPFIISPCGWDDYPSPFANKAPLSREAVAEVGRRRDSVFVECVRRLRDVVYRKGGYQWKST